MQYISFYDEETKEEVLFEVIDQLIDNNEKYILVADEEDNANILKEIKEDEENITFSLIEDDVLFQRLTLLFMESDEYDIEV